MTSNNNGGTSSSGSSGIPIGWGDRTNQMSEHDMKLGGLAANKFGSKGGMMMSQQAKNAYSNEDGTTATSVTYKTSDQVRDFYLRKIETIEQQQQQDQESVDSARNDGSLSHSNATQHPHMTTQSSSSSSVLPLGWEDRQKSRHLEQIQHGAFARTTTNLASLSLSPPPPSATTSNNTTTSNNAGNDNAYSAEIGLVRVATHTLNTLADTLNNNQKSNTTTTEISMKDREEFANAMKRVMEAMAKCR